MKHSTEKKLKSSISAIVNPSNIFTDHKRKQKIVFTTGMLVNQLRREAPKIEASFDKLCDTDLKEISSFLSKTSGLLYSGMSVSSDHDKFLKLECGKLLLNAVSSLTAAIALLRMGYVLQPGIIIRSMLEAISTVLHLIQHPDDFKKYENGSLPSPKTITAAKKLIPIFGELYGHFSDNFAHIGELHKQITPIREFNERHEALEINLGFFRMSTWLLYVTTELLFNELVDEPRYWQDHPQGYAYNPSEDEREWMGRYFKLPNIV